MIIVIALLVLIASFILAWRALPELEIPESAYHSVSSKVGSIKRWGTIIFLKGREIFYSAANDSAEKV